MAHEAARDLLVRLWARHPYIDRPDIIEKLSVKPWGPTRAQWLEGLVKLARENPFSLESAAPRAPSTMVAGYAEDLAEALLPERERAEFQLQTAQRVQRSKAYAEICDSFRTGTPAQREYVRKMRAAEESPDEFLNRINDDSPTLASGSRENTLYEKFWAESQVRIPNSIASQQRFRSVILAELERMSAKVVADHLHLRGAFIPQPRIQWRRHEGKEGTSHAVIHFQE